MTPRCPKCSSFTFQSSLITPRGSQYNIAVIACATCGVVVGATEAEAVGVLVYALTRTVEALAARLGVGR